MTAHGPPDASGGATHTRDVVVIGASAGGVEALRRLVSRLPGDLPATVLVVLHIPSYGGSALPAILGRSGPLVARHPVSGEPLERNLIYVAPANHHMVLRDGQVLLSRGPRENGHRPAIDALFRSAARWVGPRAVGVILSGVLDDGTAGLEAIHSRRGITVVQDPADALYPGMPSNAIKRVAVDHVAVVDEIPELLTRLCTEVIDFDGAPPPSPLMRSETDVSLMKEEVIHAAEHPGRPSGFSCPDCNGVLWEIDDGHVTRYRCRVGHAWSVDSLYSEQTQQFENALWMALRGLEEKAGMAREMARQAESLDNLYSARQFSEQAVEATRAATLIRSMLEGNVGLSDEGSSAHP